LPRDPVEFVRVLFKFEAKEYQQRLLEDPGKRIVVRWSRQAGKTTSIALRAIWFALTYAKTLTLIVAPSFRQSMIMGDRVQDYLSGLPRNLHRALIDKQQRTVIRFANGSRIIILPNSPQLLRGYTANQVICDEAAFFREDDLVFYNVLYPMLATTDGVLIASSTPWSKDSVFYKMCQSDEFSKHIITCDDVVKSGLIKQSFIDQMRKELPDERFRREFLSEFVEDADTWLTQSLIVNCIDSKLEFLDFRAEVQGEFYAGVDFGKHHDFSVIVIVQRRDRALSIVHVHRFPLNTEYASVIGYAKSLTDRWKNIRQVFADCTGVGDYISEDMKKSGVANVTGVSFTLQSKEEIATVLREKMRGSEVHVPYVPVKTAADVDLTAELNVEKYELLKTGNVKFTHPEGSHDDVFWATALAVSAAVKHPVVRGIVGFGNIGDSR
jgi:phage FluMu gp28-like protein